jgi:membrane-associated phospholipid phosphatase/outer membrane biosynthesis protein TonB
LRLFYLLNGWAGRSEWLDGALRFFYVGTLPLLATALAALIFLWPQRPDGSTPFVRRRLFAAGVLSTLLGVFVVVAINAFQATVLNGTPISSRPFMTHWVNLLLVEPNGNSFPCFEVMFAAACATLVWAISPRAGIFAWLFVLLLGFARTFCGSNYVGDSAAGMLLGAALSTLSLALCSVRLRFPSLNFSGAQWSWRLRHQGALSGAMLLLLFFSGVWWLWNSPAHGSKVRTLLSRSSLGQNAASAAPRLPTVASDSDNSKSESSLHETALHGDIHEGEGAGQQLSNTQSTAAPIMVVPGQMLLSSPAARMDGHLPEAEKLLEASFQSLHLPHALAGVNVAEVRAGTSAYRTAAVRFEVKETGPQERARVAATAAALVKRAFHSDSQLQHVDVLGVMVADLLPGAPESTPRPLSRPVFTASIERRDLIIRQANKPKWVNDPHLEGGLWLRARSMLFIDPQILPAAPETPKPETPKIESPEIPTPTPVPTPTLAPKKTVPKNTVPKKLTPRRAPSPASAKSKAPVVKKAAPKASPAKRNANRVLSRPVAKPKRTLRRARRSTRRSYRTRRYRRYRRYRSSSNR